MERPRWRDSGGPDAYFSAWDSVQRGAAVREGSLVQEETPAPGGVRRALGLGDCRLFVVAGNSLSEERGGTGWPAITSAA